MLLPGGGRGRPCRIVAYTDVCILNQTTLQLDFYTNKPHKPVLPPRPSDEAGDGPEEGGAAAGAPAAPPKALALLCSRPDPSQSMPELRLQVRGVNQVMGFNQRFESEDGAPRPRLRTVS